MIPKVWYTADGRDLQIRQMETEHIMSCTDLILLRARHGRRWRMRWLPAFNRELARREGKPYTDRRILNQDVATRLINNRVARINEESIDLHVDEDMWGNS